MKETLKENLLANYPEWHDNPLRLTVSEIEDPYVVLDSFFECYTLPGIRSCLQDLLHDSLRADNVCAIDHVTVHQDIEKLIEVAFLIRNQQKKIKGEANKSSKPLQSNLNENTSYHFEDKEGWYEAIADFFESFSLPQARKYLLSSLRAAESKKSWKQGEAVDLLYFFERFESLLKAVLVISKKRNINNNVIIQSSPWYTPDITQFHQYCGVYDNYMAWDYVPRALSIKEYHDPYKALEKISNRFSKREWKETLQYIRSYALGANSLAELGVDIELLLVSQLLQKMLEASHLIYVRMNVKPIEPISEK